jgi:hypothetical protein|tara:strand:+ start:239 stop:466 length:228 start_codon:yes stop_codon:yes gene_type:complete
MGKSKKSFRDELEKLAKISEIVEDSLLSEGEVSIVIVLEPKIFKKTLSHFADIYRAKEEFSIDISGTKFTFVLKK